MIDLTKVRNYYIACGYTDLRLGIDGLAAVVTQQYGGQLDEQSFFLFCGRRTDRTKALYWTGDGYILLYKRLYNSKFRWPRSEQRIAASRGVLRMAEYSASGEREQAGRSGSIQPKPKAAAHGVS